MFVFLFSVLVIATVRISLIGEESSRADFLRPFILIPTQKTAIYVPVSDRSGPPDVLCHGGVDICESGRE